MRFLYSTYEEIANKVRNENKYLIVYGAGMIGRVLIPYLITEYKLSDRLLCYLDADERKQNHFISIGETKYEINAPTYLKEITKKIIVLVTNSNYAPVVQMLDKIEDLKNTEGYIIPILQALNASLPREYSIKRNAKQCIPKKIHYCWFSGNPIPDYLKQCIESWYKFCPDYEIIRWDESNYDISQNEYMKQAYDAKKWGFVPDVARLDILYRYGGIYLDTDVELRKSLDDLLYHEAFAGTEKWGNVNMGGCSGAVPKHPMIKKLLDFRSEERFLLEDGSFNQMTCGYYETIPLMKLGMKPNNTVQEIENMVIYPSIFFHPYDYMSEETVITNYTYSIHHFNGGWLDPNSMVNRKKTSALYRDMLKRMEVVNGE